MVGSGGRGGGAGGLLGGGGRGAKGYGAGGADGLCGPHVGEADTIGQLARGIDGPLNVIAGPPAPPIRGLGGLGVRRASLGPGVVQAAVGLVRRVMGELRERGTYESMADLLIPFAELQHLLG